VQHLHGLLSTASVEDVQIPRERQRYNSIRGTPYISHLLVLKTSPKGIGCSHLASLYVPWPGNVNADGTRVNVSDVHSFTVVSAEQVEMDLLSGLQLNAYYGQQPARD
jgi:hypothetical protein